MAFSVIAAACGGTEIQTVEVIKEVTKEVPVEVIKEVEVTAPEKEKRELVFAGLNWDSALVQNGVARYIVENGYGYLTSQIEGGTVPLFQGLRNGDIDITMEIWLPNQNDAWNEATKDGEVFSVGRSLEDNWQSTFIIPGYLADANPGLVSVQDLKKDEYKNLFTEPDSGGKAVLVGCIASWSCRAVNEGQIEAYGLSDHVELRDPGTGGALAAAIEGAYKKEDPILFYYWGPTKLAFELDMRRLEQPDPSECPNNDPALGCEFPAANILIAMNTDLSAEAPELIPFFKNWDWSASNQLAADGWYGENKDNFDTSEEAYSATGIWYLKNNDAWKSWVPADVLANVEEALANEG
ncbi:MAG: ABC transporter substrate-binding protein [Chloroflexi bacterium]|nr:ABC transporter substrate-binding protein [Chloroflexota bacterium]MDA1271300.1 ABC transporter substrate-binding protein [Chloroflexota bacterium]